MILSPFLNSGTTVCFHKDGQVPLVTLTLKVEVNKRIKISEQPLIMNHGIPSSPTHLESQRRLIALLTSTAEIGAVGKKSNIIGSESVTDGQVVLKIYLK
jgi:hypothetical protein